MSTLLEQNRKAVKASLHPPAGGPERKGMPLSSDFGFLSDHKSTIFLYVAPPNFDAVNVAFLVHQPI